jgi:hypothetical protein
MVSVESVLALVAAELRTVSLVIFDQHNHLGAGHR